MAAIRVSIGEMPLLLRSMVEGLLRADHRFEMVARGSELQISESEPNPGGVHIVSADAVNRLMPGLDSFERDGSSGIVAISADGCAAQIVKVSSHHRTLGDGRRQSLADAIVDAATPLPDSRTQ